MYTKTRPSLSVKMVAMKRESQSRPQKAETKDL